MAEGEAVDPLVESMRRLIEQSKAALGPQDPSTLMLEQQLAALLASRQPARKVFWLQPGDAGSAAAPPPGRKPGR